MNDLVELPRPPAHVRAARIAAEMIVAGVETPDLDMLEQGIRFAGMARDTLVAAFALNGELDLYEADEDDCAPQRHEGKVIRHPADPDFGTSIATPSDISALLTSRSWTRPPFDVC